MGLWDQLDDEDTEPPVPAGLADLSGALRAIVDFLEIDKDLIAVAAEASPALSDEPTSGLADWITALPAAEKDKLLTMVADGEGAQVQALLRRLLRSEALAPNPPGESARLREPPRSDQKIWRVADGIRPNVIVGQRSTRTLQNQR